TGAEAVGKIHAARIELETMNRCRAAVEQAAGNGAIACAEITDAGARGSLEDEAQAMQPLLLGPFAEEPQLWRPGVVAVQRLLGQAQQVGRISRPGKGRHPPTRI